MKHLMFLLLLLSVNIFAKESPNYYKAYDEKGFKTTIQEIDRGINYSILEVDIIDSDAQGGPFSIIAAAVAIGTELQHSHFTLLKEYKKGKLNYYKLFFTSNTEEDPTLAFPNEMNQEKIKRHSEIGYLSIENYRAFLNGEM